MQINPIILISGALIGTVAAFLAHRRGRNPYLWFVLGFLFGLMGVIAFFFWGDPKKKEIKPEPTLTIGGPSDKHWYYLGKEKKPEGPYSLEAMRNNLKTGRVDQTTYVWHENLTEWKQIKEILQAE